MRWIALPAGILVLLWTLLDVFRTLVMPRAARGRVRLSRILFQLMWRPWRWIGVRRDTVQARERVLAAAVLLAAPPGLWIGDRSFLGARTGHGT